MAGFEVRFLKDVANDIGQMRCILQRSVRVDAQDEALARTHACAIFCAHEHVADWRDHADRLEVVQIRRMATRPAK